MAKRCLNCGSTDLRWAVAKANNSAVMDGRLRMHDISILGYQACEECSEVCAYVGQDELEAMLNEAH